MAGVVLLDDEQQRALGGRASLPRDPPPPPPPRYYGANANANPNANANNLPYLTRRSSLQGSEGLPRTNFLTAPPDQFDYYTTYTAAHGKISIGAASSSPRTDFTTVSGGGPLAGSDTNYPTLRRMSDANSSHGRFSEDAEEEAAEAQRYAGTTSGLRTSACLIMAGVVVGVILGIVLSQIEITTVVVRWVSLPGELYLRALKCLVIPYVFCAVAVAIGDIVFVGKVSIVGMQTFRMFLLLWVSSAIIGLSVGLAFRPFFRIGEATKDADNGGFNMVCANGEMLSLTANSNLVCGGATAGANTSVFQLDDINDVFVKGSKSSIAQFTLTDALISIITPVVSENILASLANGDLLSIVVFSMVLGTVAGRNYFIKSRRVNYLYLTLLQLRNTFFLALEWVIWLSPVAVVSIIGGSFGTNRDSIAQFDKVYMYVLAGVLAAFLQMMVVVPLIVFVLARCNPYAHMVPMVRAYMFAFACSSSLATAPITFACVKKAKMCSQSLGNFVISIGVCSNLSAIAWYQPLAIIFIAEASGNGNQLTVLRLIGVFVLAIVSSAGTPAIPAGGLVSMVSIYTSLFGEREIPESFAFVLAMDFILDRFVTVCNVNDDIMCLKVIAENTDETVTQEQLGERE